MAQILEAIQHVSRARRGGAAAMLIRRARLHRQQGIDRRHRRRRTGGGDGVTVLQQLGEGTVGRFRASYAFTARRRPRSSRSVYFHALTSHAI